MMVKQFVKRYVNNQKVLLRQKTYLSSNLKLPQNAFLNKMTRFGGNRRNYCQNYYIYFK